MDGDQRMWLRVPAAQTVVVLDYRGAPYLRFSPAGVEVNHNSEMYYLNQTPVAETPPANLTASTPPDWHRVSGGQQYGWHDGRLHALATRRADARLRVRRPVDDPDPRRRWHERDRRWPVSRRQPVDRVVLADRRGARLRARGVADRQRRAGRQGGPRARDRRAGVDRGGFRRQAASRPPDRRRVRADRVRRDRRVRRLGAVAGAVRSRGLLHAVSRSASSRSRSDSSSSRRCCTASR